MKHSIGNVSTSYIIRLILNDLGTFITTGILMLQSLCMHVCLNL